jgi:hypothetical protein
MKRQTPREIGQALIDGWDMSIDDDTMPEEWDSLSFPIIYEDPGSHRRPTKRSDDDD